MNCKFLSVYLHEENEDEKSLADVWVSGYKMKFLIWAHSILIIKKKLADLFIGGVS
jgi:hypothetical protein